jgi:hypothetical protein
LLGTPENKGRLAALAQQVAQRKKDPYAAVADLLAGAGVK